VSGVDPRRVLLVVAPYLSLKRPALGVALLKAGLLRQGIGCDIRYLCFDYADEVGIRFYELIAGHVPTHDLVGDWIFAEALHGPGTTDSSAYERTVLRDGPGFYSPSTIEKIALARDRSPDIVRRWANSIDLDRYDIVGFSSTFQQTVASLALAKELKARRPDVHMLCGGSNFEGVMGAEFHRQFSFIDVACSGEADETFPELVRRLRSGQSLADLPGLTYRADGASVGSSGPPRIVNDLDALPYPDHTEYVEAFRRSSAASSMSPELTMETSRGCWWGQKHHCTFCGRAPIAPTMKW
jgi:ribosomal peptide maturation radical SAM protein 1